MIRRTFAAVLLAAVLAVPAAPVVSAEAFAQGEPSPVDFGMPEPSLHFASGGVYISEETAEENGVLFQRRTYELYNGDQVKMGRAEAIGSLDAPVVARVELPVSAGGMVRWYDPASDSWQSAPLSGRTVRASCVIVSLERGGEALFYTPRVYQDVGSGTVRYFPALDGSLVLRQTANGWSVRLTVPSLPAGYAADYTMVVSTGPLFPGPRTLDDFWRNYTLDSEGKWRYDGYYYPSPGTYTPSGPDCYYRLPAAYLCRSFADGAAVIRAAEDLASAMLDVMSRQQNEYGYFPTLPESQWLAGDYGIGAGFYDTRFNTDLIEGYLRLAEVNPCAEFDAVLNRYFDFFLVFAAERHRETEHGGWLVDDYWHPTDGSGTHTSLNHQLAELLALYRAGEHLGRGDLIELAGRMLQAVEDTAGKWVRSDGNLHYAAYRDGSFGGQDYPYLTYNDLFNLKDYLGHSTPALDRLMRTKQNWMDAHGVNQYKK